ncbi:hypothetical protein GOBAR_DD12900 [Gossypium barbadense]|nr:hypothetical protein GOBAR_DD12900 [Gossypium barbadense]
MNDGDVSKQIQQMVRFIRQEAEEKANEISVSAEEEFNIEKLQIVEAERRKIKQEYERKAKQVEIRKKIEYSMQLNASRIKVLQGQEELSLVRLREPSVLLRCREVDRKLVETIIDEAKREYAEKFNVPPPKIVIDSVYLPPPPPANGDEFAHQPYCSGGVVLASEDGKIVLENTLDARLEVAFKQKLPEIRRRLVGQLGA